MSQIKQCSLFNCFLKADINCSCNYSFCAEHLIVHRSEYPAHEFNMISKSISDDDIFLLESSFRKSKKAVINKILTRKNKKIQKLLGLITKIEFDYSEKIESVLKICKVIELEIEAISRVKTVSVCSDNSISKSICSLKKEESLDKFSIESTMNEHLLQCLYRNKFSSLEAYHEIANELFYGQLSVVGNLIASANADFKIKVWRGHEEIKSFTGHADLITTLCISPSNNFLVSASDDKNIAVWSLETGKLISKFKGHQDSIRSIAISPDEKQIVSGGSDQEIKIWSLKGKAIANLRQHSDLVECVLFYGNTHVVSAGYDRVIILWDLSKRSSTCEMKGHLDKINSIAIRNNRVASGGNDQSIRVWDLRSGKSLQVFSMPQVIFSVDYSNCGKFIAFGAMYSLGILSEIGIIKLVPVSVACVSLKFSENNLISSENDEVIRFWKIGSD